MTSGPALPPVLVSVLSFLPNYAWESIQSLLSRSSEAVRAARNRVNLLPTARRRALRGRLVTTDEADDFLLSIDRAIEDLQSARHEFANSLLPMTD